MRNRKKSAFTLIELLVVIAIIGILSTIATVSLVQARRRARDTRRIADIQQIRNALVIYSNQRATYPPAGGEAGLVLGGAGARCLDDSDLGFHDNTVDDPCSGLIIMANIPAEHYAGHADQRYFFESPGLYRIAFDLEGEIGDLPGGNCIAQPGEVSCVP